ncbi:2-keto-4-pentenoate hydratase [Pseudoxanthomonas broegbernensis]|uniref:2-keto-4-pentenoate hydratase n=1 Tax=Pseudoxanthomonas broegbernensis TaxID=83619 RepID=UPI001618466B|nr:2-keto-4-pentenoate hydratase [Pseudoxanthomonas broegbernensis]MBB6065603.1 2-keto-4-pentenoate hydratase [Pseudoxanthomonas broegbernensis]
MSKDNGTASGTTATPELAAIAERFTRARRRGESLPGFPGTIPDDLDTAYRVQDIAIGRWPDRVVGWKVGYIAVERRDASGDERLLGPIFERNLWNATGSIIPIPIFDGGFGAIEAEFVLRLDADAPADRLHWTPEAAAALPATLFIGIEVASSPLTTINELGPRVVISDFGNNNGLLLGARIPDWAARDEATLLAETFIDGASVGTGGARRLPGGLRAAFAFALSRSARRGRPLRRGELIATGNATGIHDIAIGQRGTVVFQGHGTLECLAVAAMPREDLA